MIESALLENPAAWDRFRHRPLPAATGALITFLGAVRDHDEGRGVTGLDYEAHPSAERVLAEIAALVAAAHPELTVIRVGHRVGRLRVGDEALLAEVAAPHRAEAFAACRDLVEEVKRLVPIWKRQWFTDGTEEWVNSP